MSIRDVPLLVDISIGGCNFQSEDPNFAKTLLSTSFCKLETLTLRIALDYRKLRDFPELTCLKSLTVEICLLDTDILLDLVPILKACPFMNELELKLFSRLSYEHSVREIWPRSLDKPHPCLKIVEIVGFLACTTDRAIADWVLHNAKMLEKLIIHCRRAISEVLLPLCLPHEARNYNDIFIGAKRIALKLKEEHPSKIEVFYD